MGQVPVGGGPGVRDQTLLALIEEHDCHTAIREGHLKLRASVRETELKERKTTREMQDLAEIISQVAAQKRQNGK